MKLRKKEIFYLNFSKRMHLNNKVLPIVVRLKVNKTLVILFLINIVTSQPVLEEFYYGDVDRQYYLYIPTTIEPESPLVFVFHGFTSSAENIMEYSGMNEIAETNGFAVCYPQGTTDNNGNTFFNVGYSFHWNQTVDDVGFIIALAEHLQAHYNLSTINTFSTGMSNGEK